MQNREKMADARSMLDKADGVMSAAQHLVTPEGRIDGDRASALLKAGS